MTAPDTLYVVTDGKWFKIGITCDMDRRLYNIYSPRPPITKKHKITVVATWKHPRPRGVEYYVKQKLKKMRAVSQSFEWFKGITKDDIIPLIETVI